MQLSPGLEVPLKNDSPAGGSKIRYVNLLGDRLREFAPSYPSLWECSAASNMPFHRGAAGSTRIGSATIQGLIRFLTGMPGSNVCRGIFSEKMGLFFAAIEGSSVRFGIDALTC